MIKKFSIYLVIIVYLSSCGNNGGLDVISEDKVDVISEDKVDLIQDDLLDGGLDSAGDSGEELYDSNTDPDSERTDIIIDIPISDEVVDVLDDTQGDITDSSDFDIEQTSSRLRLIFSQPVIETRDEGGKVIVECLHIDSSGNVLPPPFDLQVVTTAQDWSFDGEGYLFEEIGEKQFICSSESLSIETTDSVVVPFEGIHRGFIRLVEFVSSVHKIMDSILLAINNNDESVYLQRIQELSTSFDIIYPSYFEGYSFYLPHPNGYPTRVDMVSAGFTDSPDDTAYINLLQTISSNIDSLRSQWELLDVSSVDPNIVNEIERLSQILKGNISDLSTLTPSEILIITQGNTLFTPLFGEKLVALLRVSVTKMEDLLEYYGPQRSGNNRNKMSIPSMVIGLVGNMILNQLPSYNKLLKDAAKAVATSALMIAAANLINRYYSVLPEAPYYDFVTPGMGANYLVPGEIWYAIGGNFNPRREKNVALLLPPVVASTFVNAVVNIVDSCNGLLSEPNILKRIKKLYDVISTIRRTIAYYNYDPLWIIFFADFVDTSDPTLEILSFPQIPNNVNPSWLPQAGIVIPLNLDVGFGQAINVTVHPG